MNRLASKSVDRLPTLGGGGVFEWKAGLPDGLFSDPKSQLG
jgi:hypothetical protein